MKIKFNLPTKKTLELRNMIIIVRAVLQSLFDVSEGIDVNKTSSSKFVLQNFLEKGFKFQSDACEWVAGLLMMSMNLSDIAVLNTQRCLLLLYYLQN